MFSLFFFFFLLILCVCVLWGWGRGCNTVSFGFSDESDEHELLIEKRRQNVAFEANHKRSRYAGCVEFQCRRAPGV